MCPVASIDEQARSGSPPVGTQRWVVAGGITT